MDPLKEEHDLREPEWEPTWYWQPKGVFGNFYVHWILSALYLLIALLPIFWLVITGDIPEWAKNRRIVFAWGLIVAVAHPVWSWLETKAFERWVRRSNFTDPMRKIERAYYAQMRDHSKAFWAAILTLYAFAGLGSSLFK